MSSPTDPITVAVAEETLIKSTHYGFLDVPGHGAMIAHIFSQLKGSLLSISQLVNLGLHASYCSNFVTFDRNKKQGGRSGKPRFTNRLVDGGSKESVHGNCQWDASVCIRRNPIRLCCGLRKFLARSVRLTGGFNIYVRNRQLVHKIA